MVRFQFVVLVGIFQLFYGPQLSNGQSETRTIAKEGEVLAIYFDSPRKVSPQLITAIWPDGKAIWSSDLVEGGAPYSTAMISEKAVRKVLDTIRKNGYHLSKNVLRARAVPSGATTHMVAGSGTHQVEMVSCHEVFEQRGEVVLTSEGIVPIGRDSKTEILAKESINHLHFRVSWLEIKSLIYSLTFQAKGDPVELKSRYHNGNVEITINKK